MKYTDQDKATVQAINEWLERDHNQRRGWSQASLALNAGLDRSTVSRVLNGTYPHDPKQTIAKLMDVIRAENARYSPTNDVVYTEISTSRVVAAACHSARRKKKFSVVSGVVGIGKSEALKNYASNHSNTYYVRCFQGMTRTVLLNQLINVTGTSITKANGKAAETVAEKLFGLAERLRDTNALILVDEAERMQGAGLEDLRYLRDEAACGIVLAGNQQLVTLLAGKGTLHGQIRSRVGFAPPTLEAITETDASSLVRSNLGDFDKQTMQAFWELCRGSARVLVEDLIDGCKTHLQPDNLEINPANLYALSTQLLGYNTLSGADDARG